MSGHVFVVHGDLTHLACDEWLLPTDADLTLTDAWLPAFAEGAVRRGDDGVPRLQLDTEGFGEDDRRVVAVPDDRRAHPADPTPVTGARAWLLDVGTTGSAPLGGTEAAAAGRAADPQWLVAGVRQWLDATRDRRRRSDRARPLLALPLVGTGAGGAASRRDQVLAELLPALDEHAGRHGVDVALVLNDRRDHAAAQHTRHRLGERCWDLDDPLREAAVTLARHASAGRLALFLGAGVSRAAGLPLWNDLVAELLDEAGVAASEREAVARLEVPDQTEFVARRLAGGGEALEDWVRRRFAPRPHALAHCLLAALGVRESVTTNWDPLYEQAVADTGQRLAVIPEDEAQESDSWLLKLHGDAARKGSAVVVRRSDYLRFGAEQSALAGLVHALLLTRHVLFVGFSLVDDNFIRIADDVTRLVDRRLGTTLALHHDPAKQELWPHLEHLVLGPDDAEAAELARRLEIFLDLLSAQVDRAQAFLLDERYAGLLDDADRGLAERLAALAASADELGASQSWPRVQRLLSELGHPGGDN